MSLSLAPAAHSCHLGPPHHLSSNLRDCRKRTFSLLERKLSCRAPPESPAVDRPQERSMLNQSAMGHRQSRQERQGVPSRSTTSNTKIQYQQPLHSQGDIPPAYTEIPTAAAFTTRSTVDDEYAFLTSFDTVVLIDDSGSMAGRSWRETKDALEMIVPVCVQHDSDGIDMYFLVSSNTSDPPIDFSTKPGIECQRLALSP